MFNKLFINIYVFVSRLSGVEHVGFTSQQNEFVKWNVWHKLASRKRIDSILSLSLSL